MLGKSFTFADASVDKLTDGNIVVGTYVDEVNSNGNNDRGVAWPKATTVAITFNFAASTYLNTVSIGYIHHGDATLVPFPAATDLVFAPLQMTIATSTDSGVSYTT